MQWKEIMSGVVIGAILSGVGLYFTQSNQMVKLQTELDILKVSSLDFKNTQKQLGQLSVRQEIVNKKELELKKVELDLKAKEQNIHTQELTLKLKQGELSKKFANLEIEKRQIKEQEQRLSLVSRGEKYMNDYISNYSHINRGINYICSKNVIENTEYNDKVRKANTLLTGIFNIGNQIKDSNEFYEFAQEEINKVTSYSTILRCL